ncbi:MAG: ABC transporter permease, partial [Kiritimatiellae bacterium]|nr:ABC transporter permease [Kiritimatiellia bacterium]
MITREPFQTNVLFSIFGRIGRAGCMTFESLLFMFGIPFSRRSIHEWFKQMYTASIKTLPLVTIVGTFTGMILALQVGLELRRFSQEVYIGSAVMVSLLREMGPFMAGIILSACVGSSMAAQIGT